MQYPNNMYMADVKTEQEPSIEEILESIRQIISEDGATPAEASPPAPKPAAPSPVLDLVEKVTPTPAPVSPPAPPPAPIPPPPSPVAETVDTVMDQNTPDSSSLMSAQTADAASDALSKILVGNVAVERDNVPGRVGPVTLEEMTLDIMKPMIKTWIDRNLPGIVEKAVQKEIEKLSRRATDR